MALWKETTENEQGAAPAQEQSAPPSPVPPRKEISAQGRRESFFGPGVTIEGKIEGDADVRIGGKLTGNIEISGNLRIDKGARVAATMNATTVTIEGEVEGNVSASAQVEILASGQVIGDVKAATLTVAAGSRMRGKVEFGWTGSESAKLTSIRTHEKAKTGSAV
jgi:cytoskeletal protein CcmA (bactofilin family)